MYSFYAKNYEKDQIYITRLQLIEKIGFDYKKTAQRYSYFNEAFLGIILIEAC